MTPSAGGARPDPKKWPVRRAESYGGVVFRPGSGELEVALIRTKNLREKDVWALPKGGREEGEDEESAALREVREETGWKRRSSLRWKTSRTGSLAAGAGSIQKDRSPLSDARDRR